MLEVTLFLDEDDMLDQIPAYEYILRYLMHHEIAGASAFTAVGGFGHKHHLNDARRLGTADDRPMMILFIDEEEKVRKVLPHLKGVLKEGLIVAKHAVLI